MGAIAPVPSVFWPWGMGIPAGPLVQGWAETIALTLTEAGNALGAARQILERVGEWLAL